MHRVLVFLLAVFSAQAGYWDAEIEAFEREDQLRGAPQNVYLFIGSSSIRMWSLREHFPSIPGLNRGFGSSQVRDLLDYYERIVTPYSPKKVILYSGENDLDYGKSVEEVFEAFRQLIARFKEDEIPSIVWMLPKKTAARAHLHEKIDQLNQKISKEFLFEDTIEILDPNLVLGLPANSSQMCQEDLMHLNERAYGELSQVMRRSLWRSWRDRPALR